MKIELPQDEFNLEILDGFLIRAKKHGYASGKPPRQDLFGNKFYVYREQLPSGRAIEFYDTYVVGPNRCFTGFQKASLELSDREFPAVWGMGYHGVLLVPEREEEINAFLRECLLMPPSGFPVRGPIGKPIIKGNLRYDHFSDESDLSRFSSVEVINIINEDVDRLEAHNFNCFGGKLLDF